MKRFNLWMVCAAVLLGLSAQVFGAGFALYEGSAKGMATGGLAGSANDPAALFYNPAGITQLSGTHFMGGVALIAPSAEVTTQDFYSGSVVSMDNEDNIFTPPHFYYTRQMTDKVWLGLGVYTRFGLGSEFEPNWAGRYNNINASIETLTFSPTLAYKINDALSVSVGAVAMWIDVELSSYIDAGLFLGLPHNDPATDTFDVKQTIAGDNISYGFSAAMHYKPNDRMSFGLSYNSQVKQEIDGQATFDKTGVPLIPDSWFTDTAGSAKINLPEMVFGGAYFKINEKWDMELGVTYTDWSSYQHLQLNYATPLVEVPALDISVNQVTRLKNWGNVYRYNIGGTYKYSDSLTLMAGYIYDESPVPVETIEYQVPTSNRNLYNLGVRWETEKWYFDATYSYLVMDEREFGSFERQLADGVLPSQLKDSMAHLVGLSVGYKF